VGTKMEIRPIKKSEFDELKRISRQAFVLNEERINRWFTKDFDLSRTRALFVDGQMESVLEIIPFQVWFNDRKIPMGGISGVASPPESRRKGYVRKLMEYSLNDMKEKGFPISTLYPFSFDFYRKFGWEHASDWRVYSFDPKDLGKMPDPKGEMLQFSEKELDSVNQAYNEFSKTKTCSILRAKKHWLERVMTSYEREMYSYLWSDYRGKVQGYIIYEIIDHGDFKRTVKVRELVVLNHEARCAILSFLRNHDSQAQKIEFRAPLDDPSLSYFVNPRIDIKIVPSFMARIVDLIKALESKSYSKELRDEAVFELVDTKASWNNGIFSLTVEEGKGRAKITNKEPDFSCDIKTFSQIYCGYIDLIQAATLGKLEIKNTNKLDKINNLFPQAIPYLNDFF